MPAEFKGKKLWSGARSAIGRSENGTLKSLGGSPIARIENDRITTLARGFMFHVKPSTAEAGGIDIMDPLGNLHKRIWSDG